MTSVFHTIISHRNFHQDEAWAILLLKRFGRNEYPGIEFAKVEFIDDPQSVDARELVSKGKVCVGCGSGLYDEHGRERGLKTCAAELVARHLKLMDNRAITNIIDYVRHCDRTRDVRPQELPSLIKKWHQRHRNEPHLVLERTLAILEDWLDGDLDFQKTFQLTVPDKRMFQLTDGGARQICYAVFNTDNPNTQVVARIKKVDVVITKNSRGNIAVFTRSEKTGNGDVPVVDLSDAIRIIRQGEMLKRGQSYDGLTDEYLRGAEKLEECPYWYYLQAGQMLLNGSDQAASGVEPTKLSVEDVVQAIKVGSRPFKVGSTNPTGSLATIGEARK